MVQINCGAIEIGNQELVVIQQAIASHRHARAYTELLLHKELGEGRSTARVIEAEWCSGGRGTHARSVLKIDHAERLARESRFSQEYGELPKLFMRVVAQSFDDMAAPPKGLGCIIYEHPAGDFPGEFTSLEKRCRQALVTGKPSLDEIVAIVGTAVEAVTGLQAGKEGRRIGSGLDQLAYYLRAWAPTAVVEVKQLQRDPDSPNTLRLFLADEPRGVHLKLGSDPVADKSHVGKVIQFLGNELYIDASRVFVNLGTEFAVELRGLEPARVREAAREVNAAKLTVNVCGRVLDAGLAFYQNRVRDLGFEPEHAQFEVAGVSFQNPLTDYISRARRWARRQPAPEFALGHGDLHAGNVLCSSTLPVIIDHAWYEEHHPCWADTARLLGSLWLNAIAPELTSEEVAGAIAYAFRASREPRSERATWAGRFWEQAIESALRHGSRSPAGARELWIDLHNFAWIAFKWPAKPSAHLAMLMLAAVAIEKVESKAQAIAIHQELGDLLVADSGPAALGQVPQLVDDAFDKLRAYESHPQELQRPLYYELQGRLRQRLAKMELEASPGEGVLSDLLNHALLGSWSHVHNQEVGKLRWDLAEDPRDRVVVADALFFAYVTTRSTVAFGHLLDLAIDGDPLVETEVALLLSLLLRVSEVWESLDRDPRLQQRLRRVLQDMKFAEMMMVADSARWAFIANWPALERLEQNAPPRTFRLRPFDPGTDIPSDVAPLIDDDLRTRLGESVSLTDSEKRALVKEWHALTPQQRAAIHGVLTMENKKVHAKFDSLSLRAIQRLITLTNFVMHANSASGQRLLAERRATASRSFAELISDKSMAARAAARHEVERASALMEDGQGGGAIAALERADQLFAAAQELSPLSADDRARWTSTLYNWGRELNKLSIDLDDADERRRLGKQACDKLERALRIQPDHYGALGNLGLQLGELAILSESADQQQHWWNQACDKYERALQVRRDRYSLFALWGNQSSRLADCSEGADLQRRLRALACDKYERAVELKPDDHQLLLNCGDELGKLAKLSDDAASQWPLRQKACNKYERALGIKPDDHETFFRWGTELFELAALSSDAGERRQLAEQARDKHERALSVRPNHYLSLRMLIYDLIDLANLSSDMGEQRQLREQASDKLEQALLIRPDDADALDDWSTNLLHLMHLSSDQPELRERHSQKCEEALRRQAHVLGVPIIRLYNYACLLALRDQRAEALDSLAECLSASVISQEHVRKDSDWRGFHQEPRWQELVGLGSAPGAVK